jgi:hypothetical protein
LVYFQVTLRSQGALWGQNQIWWQLHTFPSPKLLMKVYT